MSQDPIGLYPNNANVPVEPVNNAPSPYNYGEFQGSNLNFNPMSEPISGGLFQLLEQFKKIQNPGIEEQPFQFNLKGVQDDTTQNLMSGFNMGSKIGNTVSQAGGLKSFIGGMFGG